MRLLQYVGIGGVAGILIAFSGCGSDNPSLIGGVPVVQISPGESVVHRCPADRPRTDYRTAPTMGQYVPAIKVWCYATSGSLEEKDADNGALYYLCVKNDGTPASSFAQLHRDDGRPAYIDCLSE